MGCATGKIGTEHHGITCSYELNSMDPRLSFIQLHAKNQHNKPQQRLFVLALVE